MVILSLKRICGKGTYKMDLLILLGIGFIGVMIIIVGLLSIGARKVAAPSKELEEKVDRLEKDLETLRK